jgi:hypothetical protein
MIERAQNKNSVRTQSFQYDALNRLTKAQTQSGAHASYCYGNTYLYDRWGNLTAANQIPSQTNCAGYLLSVSTDGNNHLTGYRYDAAGNMTKDSVNTYTYNAENEMTSAGSASYKYDGEGRQVNNSAGTLFWYGLSGQVLAELQGTSNWSDYISANGRRIAKADNFEYRIHTYGNNCSNCGNQDSGYAFLGPQGYGGYYDYIMQSGDKLCWRQWESGGVGGIMMIFNDNTNTNWVTYDQDGQLMNTDGIQGSWHYRRVDLSAYAGKSLQSINLIQQGDGTNGGPWDIYFQDVVLVSADGTVRPLYNRRNRHFVERVGDVGGQRTRLCHRLPHRERSDHARYHDKLLHCGRTGVGADDDECEWLSGVAGDVCGVWKRSQPADDDERL